jgi:hypothetical protein
LAYSTERRAAVLKKLEPPNAVPLRQLAKDEGISEATLRIPVILITQSGGS